MNQIRIDLERRTSLDRNVFGGFAEHLGRCIYGGIYEPGSPFADEQGIRTDVLNALCRLQMPIMRYPGGNFVSGYRWMDGIGPQAERKARVDLAWNAIEPNEFGTNEFIDFVRKLNTEPYFVVNAGDGDMREARDWVEYCNGTVDSALVKLRRQHGYEQPHGVKYWGIGNEVDGHWQIGYKTPYEYARTYLEFAKVMKWVDPSIKMIASIGSDWKEQWIERTQLLFEQASKHLDYISIHWYVGNRLNDFADYMANSEIIEDRLSAFEGLIRAMRLQYDIKRPIWLAVDEWNVWYRTHPSYGNELNRLEEKYNLEDALMVGMQLNAFIRHAASVKMANLAQIVNVIAPIFTNPDGLFLQTIFYPFELYSQTAGSESVDVFWQGDTFSTAEHSGLRFLDVSATLDEARRTLSVFVVNRSQDNALETTLSLTSGAFAGPVRAVVVNGPDIKSENSFTDPNIVGTHESQFAAKDTTKFTYSFEPHSVTALIFDL
jgi:alpha-L-arabinofuranosidase